MRRIINKKTIGTILMVCIFVLCFILMVIVQKRSLFVSGNKKEIQVNEKSLHASFYTMDYENVMNYPVRETPKGKELGRIPRRRVVNVIAQTKDKEDSYYKVEYGKLTGWVKAERLAKLSDESIGFAKDTAIYICTGAYQHVNLYPDHAWNKNAILKNIPYGTELTLLEVNSGWGKVTYQNKTGWINLAFAAIYIPGKWRVAREDDSVKFVPLRKHTKVKSQAIDKIPLGQIVEITEFKNGWGKVTYKNKTGWVKMLDLALNLE